MTNVSILPVIANCVWKPTTAAGFTYAHFQFANGWIAEIWKMPNVTFTVRVLGTDEHPAVHTDFGGPRTGLEEMAANFAIREIMDLDRHGRNRDYLDERPER